MSCPQKSIGQNFALLSSGQLATRFLSFLATIHIAKTLGANGLGQLLICTSILAYAASFVDFGIQKFGPVKIGRNDQPLDELVSNVMILRSLVATPILIFLLILTAISPFTISQKMMAVLYLLSLVINIFDLSWVFVGTRWVMPSAVCNMASQMLYAGGVFFFIKNPQQIDIVPAVFLGSNLALVVAQLFFFTAKYQFRFKRPDLLSIKSLGIAALPLMGSSVIGLILVNFEILITGAFLSSLASGLYGAASKVTTMLIILAGSYFTVLAPFIAGAYKIGKAPLEKLLQVSLKLTTALAIGIIAGGLVLSAPIMEMLFGPDFQPATGVFQILLFSFGLLAISRNYRMCLIATGHQNVDVKVVSVSALVTIITCPLMVKMFGILGAAYVTVLAELIMLIGFAIEIRRLRLSLPFLPYFWKPFCCALLMSFCLLIFPNITTVFRILEGAAIYTLAMFLLKITTFAEVSNFLRGTLPAETASPTAEPSICHSLQPVSSVGS